MSHLTRGGDPRELFVWVNPADFLTRHNAGMVGAFACGPVLGVDSGTSKRMFVPNPDFSGQVSPFQLGLLRSYLADHHLEMVRVADFPDYPSRLDAGFFFDTPEAAHTYAAAHSDHVRGRSLKKLVTEGEYAYSVHDAGWIDFLRGPGALDIHTLDSVARAYWSGKPADGPFAFMGTEMSIQSVPEVLFYGLVRFLDRNLGISDA